MTYDEDRNSRLVRLRKRFNGKPIPERWLIHFDLDCWEPTTLGLVTVYRLKQSSLERLRQLGED